MIGLIKNELTRLFLKTKWFIILPAAIVSAHLFGVQTVEFIVLSDMLSGENVWDGVFYTFSVGFDWTIGLFFFTAFVFIAGDRLSDDINSGYLSWLLVRNAKHKGRIWMAKIVSVLIGAMVFSFIYSIVVLSFNMVFLPKSMAWGPIVINTAAATAELSHSLAVQSNNFLNNTSPLVAFIYNIIFMGLGLGALTSLLLLTTFFIQKSYLPLIISVLFSFSTGAIFQYIGMRGLSPTTRMNFYFHTGIVYIEPMMVYTETIMFWVFLIFFSIYVGKVKMER